MRGKKGRNDIRQEGFLPINEAKVVKSGRYDGKQEYAKVDEKERELRRTSKGRKRK